jgi:predicted RNA binding protein YcfA (HicA-like mRNA interferase family)
LFVEKRNEPAGQAPGQDEGDAREDPVRASRTESILLSEGFALANTRGSHHSYKRADGRVLTIVRPHGRHGYCRPGDIRKILEVIQ